MIVLSWITLLFVKRPLGLVLYCYSNMQIINKTYMIWSYLYLILTLIVNRFNAILYSFRYNFFLKDVFKSKGFAELSEDSLVEILKSDGLTMDEGKILKYLRDWSQVNAVSLCIVFNQNDKRMNCFFFFLSFYLNTWSKPYLFLYEIMVMERFFF